MAAEQKDAENNILYRDSLNYVILNLFPYTNGHLMIVPFKHEGSLSELAPATSSEMMELAKQALRALEQEYHPDGFNVGFNLGRSAGAGVAEHIHLHVVPRWSGDANFLTVIGETRVMPEDLATTYEKLKKHFGPRHATASPLE
jgi:ATP adenylyltransferase